MEGGGGGEGGKKDRKEGKEMEGEGEKRMSEYYGGAYTPLQIS